MASEISVNLGKTLRKIRIERHFTQIEFADLIGISFRYLSDIENGKRNISLDVLESFANGLHMHMSTIIYQAERS